MTANGWLQIIVYLAVILAVTKPIGVFMARVFNRERTFLDPVLRPVERLLVSPDPGGRRTRDALDGVCVRHAAVQRRLHAGAVPDRAHAADPALESAEVRGGGSRSGFQHGGFVHHQHQLAELWRRSHHELSHADGRPGVSQLRFGGGRHRAGDRVHSRHCAPGERNHRQFLG